MVLNGALDLTKSVFSLFSGEKEGAAQGTAHGARPSKQTSIMRIKRGHDSPGY